MKTPVLIVGSGPSGLLLSRLLSQAGVESVLVERQTGEYVLGRIRAGVLESGSAEILREAGVGKRLDAEGLPHDGFELGYGGEFFRIDLKGLTGKNVCVYGQTEITKDLMNARIRDNSEQTFYSAENVRISGLEKGCPRVDFERNGSTHTVYPELIAGCDGYHGPSRKCIPKDKLKIYERIFNFSWLGILSDTKPVSHELIYANDPAGFALCSMRSPTRSRYYLQCPLDTEIRDWSDKRFWKELKQRLGEGRGENLETGDSIEKSIAPLRSFLAEPMSYENLYLAGDSAHIVPPTGAKGLNLAIGDVKLLAESMIEYFKKGSKKRLESYSGHCLSRVWKTQRFSWSMSQLLHRFDFYSEYERKMQKTEFEYIRDSEAAAKSLAENYVGLPIEGL